MDRIALPSIYSRTNSSVSLYKPNQISFEERKWFNKRGKQNAVIFTAEMLNQLRQYFDDLDSDKSGSIGIEELQEPLITLEFCQNREEVRRMIKTIDLDGSGQIQFGEFLEIFRKIKLSKYNSQAEAENMKNFVKIFDKNSRHSSHVQKDVNYRLALSELRRKKILNDLTQEISIKPKSMRKKQIKVSFLKKVKAQFKESSETEGLYKMCKEKNYNRMKLI